MNVFFQIFFLNATRFTVGKARALLVEMLRADCQTFLLYLTLSLSYLLRDTSLSLCYSLSSEVDTQDVRPPRRRLFESSVLFLNFFLF